MRGKQVKTIDRLMKLARERKAVVVNQHTRDWRTPAAFLQNWQANKLWPIIKRGDVYEYKKPSE